jgi:hypothetical protein
MVADLLVGIDHASAITVGAAEVPQPFHSRSFQSHSRAPTIVDNTAEQGRGICAAWVNGVTEVRGASHFGNCLDAYE